MNNKAHQIALAALDEVFVNPTSLISYQSKGFVLIICHNIEAAKVVAAGLNSEFSVHYLLTNETTKSVKNPQITHGKIEEISGYLGSFEVKLAAASFNTETGGNFDIIIDLIGAPNVAKVPPFGFYHLTNNTKNTAIFAEINQLLGILDKPKYFNFDASICVHSRNKTALCSRCIDACPADAIRDFGDVVEVDANLCHGCGGCSSACPTGAISYAYPTIDDHAKKIAALVGAYLGADGSHAKLLFYAAESAEKLPKSADNILPFAVEEVGFLGLETLLYAFCVGVEEVFIHCQNEPLETTKTLEKQIRLCHQILQSLGHGEILPFVQIVDGSIVEKSTHKGLKPIIGELDLFNKRQRIFALVDFLNQGRSRSGAVLCDFTEDDDAPFGEVKIDDKLCTLCMACTSICPPKALSSGSLDTPIVNFQEDLCVQCGLCVKSCPENAMQLNPRLLFAADKRSQKTVLNQDQPFKCTECGKVFGSNQVIQKMLEKLKNHSMFTDGKIENLTKCEDCRVKALF